MIRNMKSLGIIAEFNPFHEGHEYLIQKAMADTDADICVVVMSGNFVQRGMPAVYDKWTRAADAVNKGVNLVVELPSVYAVNSAEYFAKGGVEILEAFGCLDYIAFGSESGNLEDMRKAATFLGAEDDLLKEKIQGLMRQGYSHPKAREMAVLEMETDFDKDLIKEPNNILGLEYLKQLKTLTPYTIKRNGEGYHISASKIRKEMEADTPERFRQQEENYWHLVASKILQMDVSQLKEIFGADQGLAHKLKKEVRYASSAEELMERLKSKVYTHSRISRMLTQILLEIKGDDVEQAVGYIRVLAFDRKGAKFLKEIKKRECNKLPILTNINKEAVNYPQIQKTLEKDILSSDMYNLISGKNLYKHSDYVVMPYSKL